MIHDLVRDTFYSLQIVSWSEKTTRVSQVLNYRRRYRWKYSCRSIKGQRFRLPRLLKYYWKVETDNDGQSSEKSCQKDFLKEKIIIFQFDPFLNSLKFCSTWMHSTYNKLNVEVRGLCERVECPRVSKVGFTNMVRS